MPTPDPYRPSPRSALDAAILTLGRAFAEAARRGVPLTPEDTHVWFQVTTHPAVCPDPDQAVALIRREMQAALLRPRVQPTPSPAAEP